ncbi:MAG: signal recognition particle-docking protein FtsY [Desulfobacteraceae bacterium]|nr:signal recognition particle-docking protein FtsY [Desulfobacteraceae bacterium]
MQENLEGFWEALTRLLAAVPREVWWGVLVFILTIVLTKIIQRLAARKTPKPPGKPQVEAPVPSAEDAGAPPRPAAETAPPLAAQPAAQDTAATPTGFLARLTERLGKTRRSLAAGLEGLFRGQGRIDADMLEELEELLITADIGVGTTAALMDRISARKAEIANAEQLKNTLKEEILALVATAPPPPQGAVKPHVIMAVGVNGVGKTTTIGKLAARYTAAGQKVLIGAADTFRAAAGEQLEIWARRSGAEIVRHRENADPAAVAFDTIEAALARGVDVVLVDTAGRLHTKVNLMAELQKIQRTIDRKLPGAPHEVLLVLDATTGQNALAQAKLFQETVGVTGIALTKLDGTAKGGIVIGICNSLQIPLKYIGIGEKIADLQDFDPQKFVSALF